MDYSNYNNPSYTNQQPVSTPSSDRIIKFPNTNPENTTVRTVEANRSLPESSETRLFGSYKNTKDQVLQPISTPDAPLLMPVDLGGETAPDNQNPENAVYDISSSPTGLTNSTTTSVPTPDFINRSRFISRSGTSTSYDTNNQQSTNNSNTIPFPRRQTVNPVRSMTSNDTTTSSTRTRLAENSTTGFDHRNNATTLNNNNIATNYSNRNVASDYNNINNTTNYNNRVNSNTYDRMNSSSSEPTNEYSMNDYMNSPYYQYDNSSEYARDQDYLKQLYPSVCQRIQREIEAECDRLDYNGSSIYDEYPDRATMELIIDRIYDRLKDMDDTRQHPELSMTEQGPALEEDDSFDTIPSPLTQNSKLQATGFGDGYYPGGYGYGGNFGGGYCSTCRNNWFRNAVNVMFYNELFSRRRNHYNRRFWF